MNRIFRLFAVLTVLALTAGCSVTSEKYRYQHRFDKFYQLLNKNEASDFAANDLAKLGDSLEKRLATDPKLSNAYRAAQTVEAINIFDATGTARFYREIILRELNRNNYYRLMDFLSGQGQSDFARKQDFQKTFDSLYGSDRRFQSFIDGLKKEYRLYGFSNSQIVDFFRSISFPEVTRRELYATLKLLKETQALADFKSGDMTTAAQKLDQNIAKTVAVRYANEALRKRTGLTKVNSQEFLSLYFRVIMKEMDPGAVSRTLGKF